MGLRRECQPKRDGSPTRQCDAYALLGEPVGRRRDLDIEQADAVFAEHLDEPEAFPGENADALLAESAGNNLRPYEQAVHGDSQLLRALIEHLFESRAERRASIATVVRRTTLPATIPAPTPEHVGRVAFLEEREAKPPIEIVETPRTAHHVGQNLYVEWIRRRTLVDLVEVTEDGQTSVTASKIDLRKPSTKSASLGRPSRR